MRLNQLGPVAGAHYLGNERIGCIVGPVGSGKSTASCLRLQRHAYQQQPQSDGIARTRWAIVRNTKPQLEDTTIKTWLQVFPENEYGLFRWGDHTHHWQFKPQGWDYKIDAEFIFRGLDDAADVANLLSLEVTGFYFNELREIHQQILVHAGRRAGRFPAKSDGGCTWSGWFGDTNPWDVDHYLHEWFVEKPREGYVLRRQPGGMSPQAENRENLEDGYYEKALIDYTSDDAKVYVHAEFGHTRTGKPIYTEYVDSLHCRPFELDPRLPLDLGYDFGRTPAAVIAQFTPHGWRIRDELCATDMGVKKHGQALKAMIAQKYPGFEIRDMTGDPSGDTRDAEDNTVFDILKGVGILGKAAPTNELTVRIDAVNGTFMRIERGEPSILIHPDCKVLRRACLDGYRYPKLKVLGDRYGDKPEKNQWSHVAEALQYLLLGGGEGRVVMNKPRNRTTSGRQRYAET